MHAYDYLVFKFSVYDTNYLICHVSELPPGGFTSLYSFTKETAETIERAGIAGYKGPVNSTQLAMDFDDDESANEAIIKLIGMGLGFDVWTTGNRGLHIYVDRPHAPTHLLPKIDREWVAINFPKADLSVYSHLHMFRNREAIHDKTGRKKLWMSRYFGPPLILPETVTERQYVTESMQNGPRDSIFLNQYIMTLSVPHDEGQRHESLMKIGLTMKGLGEPIEFIHRWLQHVNMLFREKKDDGEIERLVQFIQEAVVESE